MDKKFTLEEEAMYLHGEVKPGMQEALEVELDAIVRGEVLKTRSAVEETTSMRLDDTLEISLIPAEDDIAKTMMLEEEGGKAEEPFLQVFDDDDFIVIPEADLEKNLQKRIGQEMLMDKEEES